MTRKFNHDEARTLYFIADWSMARIAEFYGVSYQSVYRACRGEDYYSEIIRQNNARSMSGVCRDCGKTGISVRAVHCNSCAHPAESVREGTLRCQTCRQWKPDDDFSHSRTKIARRGRHSQCRVCQSQARREYLHRTKVAA